MSEELPSRPSLENLQKQAKGLLKSFRAGDAAAFARVKKSHPGRARKSAIGAAAKLLLVDAQLVLAREHGFTSWKALRDHIATTVVVSEETKDEFHAALEADDVRALRRLLKRYPIPASLLNPLVSDVRSSEMLDALLDAGADIDAKSDWWAGGFGVLHHAKPEVAKHAIDRGATVDIHAAARLGLVDRVRKLVAADPALVAARGGDGQTPLHFAATVEIAEHLLDQGADINALDVDHVSTAAQYMVRDRQKVARFLVERGCHTDLLLLAALGDNDRILALLDRDPGAIHLRVTDEFFPMIGGKTAKNGGTIYQWTLGWYVSPLDVAQQFGHRDTQRLLWERSPADVRLLDACWQGDLAAAKKAAKDGGIAPAELSKRERRHLAHAARNNHLAAVKTMLELGFPTDGTSQHGATALHWAAYHGNAAMTKLLLGHSPALEQCDADFNGPPMAWAMHGSRDGWHRQSGDYGKVVELLIKAGAQVPPDPLGSPEVMAALRKHGKER